MGEGKQGRTDADAEREEGRRHEEAGLDEVRQLPDGDEVEPEDAQCDRELGDVERRPRLQDVVVLVRGHGRVVVVVVGGGGGGADAAWAVEAAVNCADRWWRW